MYCSFLKSMIFFWGAAHNSRYFILNFFTHTLYILSYMCIFFPDFFEMKFMNFKFFKIKGSMELDLQNALLDYIHFVSKPLSSSSE